MLLTLKFLKSCIFFEKIQKFILFLHQISCQTHQFGKLFLIIMQNTDYQGIKFSKFHGAGNDFVMINAIKSPVSLTDDEVKAICDRRTGVGADGLIMVLPSEKYAFRMKYYNCDGHESTFCGNGGRCIAAFAVEEGLAPQHLEYEAIDGVHKAILTKNSDNEYMVSITMRDIESWQIDENRLLINTGSPHYVTRVKNLKDFDVRKVGAEIRNDKNISKDGVNVDFMELIDNQYHIRTFERGVEDETLACGTGVTASAIAAALWYGGDNINIRTTLATLNVRFEKSGNSIKNIVLSGPATHVFDGFYIFEK